jgi:hypothetical protein
MFEALDEQTLRRIVVASISGGPITRVEMSLLPGLIAGVVADLSSRDLEIGAVRAVWLHFETMEQLLRALQGYGGIDVFRTFDSWTFGEPGQWIEGDVQHAEHDLLASVPGATPAARLEHVLAQREPTQAQLDDRLGNAIDSKSTERVQELLGLRADNTRMTEEEHPGPRADPNSRTFLITAAVRFLDGVVAALLAAGADPNQTSKTMKDGNTALSMAVQTAARAPPDKPAVARTLALLEVPTLGCTLAEHAAKLTVGAAVSWTSTTHPDFPTEREGKVVKIRDNGDLVCNTPLTSAWASGKKGWFAPVKLRLRGGA